MIKCFCDACNGEITSHRRAIDIPCHLMEGSQLNGYINQEGDRVSGRLDHFDLCEKCVNIVYGAAAKVLKNMRETIPANPLDEHNQ